MRLMSEVGASCFKQIRSEVVKRGGDTAMCEKMISECEHSTKTRSIKMLNVTAIDNDVFDSNLSFQALGILAYITSKDDGMPIKISEIKDIHDDGVDDAVQSLIDEGFIYKFDSNSVMLK